MALHLGRIKNLAFRRPDMILATIDAEMSHPDGRLIDLREVETEVGNRRLLILRCFVQGDDSGVFANVGWVLNDSTDACLVCAQPFTHFRWKHHCRACGALVCAVCCAFSAEIITQEHLGPQRVCVECFRGPVSTRLIHCVVFALMTGFFRESLFQSTTVDT